MENPYESPSIPDRALHREERPREAEHLPFEVPAAYAQFALRLLGVYLCIAASLSFSSSVLALLLAERSQELIVDPIAKQYLEIPYFASCLVDVLQFVVGIYFCISGRWVIEAVFVRAGK